jgi:hypothetical protein
VGWLTASRWNRTKTLSGIHGISGVVHHPLALGVDEASNRLVVITDESTPRHAAMMQVDLGVAGPSKSVATIPALPKRFSMTG